MNKRMERDRKKIIERLMPGATIVDGEVFLMQNFLFPGTKDWFLNEVEKQVQENETVRQNNKLEESM